MHLSPLGELCECLRGEMASHLSQGPLLVTTSCPRGLDNFKVSSDTSQSFCFVYVCAGLCVAIRE